MSRHLHIVCLDVPWPADYGGAIDMMNRIIALKKLDVLIHLHYFSYNERGMPNELNQFCETIDVYERKKGRQGLSLQLPYIVASRVNDKLIERLKQDDYPILLEGLHCTGVLPYLDLSRRKVAVRMHNDEYAYYKELAHAEHTILKKWFYHRESKLIKKYSEALPKECLYVSVSHEDLRVFKEVYHLTNSVYISIFPSWQKVTCEEGIGNLCLYHGNLSVPENEKAAIWLLQKVFTQVRKPFVIAGKKPSRRLQKIAHLCQHTCLVADPTETEMNDLVRKAHINVLPCFNKEVTGIRLKLLHALYQGRHCIVNQPMVKGTGLEDACHIGTSATAFASIIAQLYHQPFTPEEILLRKRILGSEYNNEENARLLMQYLY